MDLFKERKKNRRKKSTTGTPSTSGGGGGDSTPTASIDVTASDAIDDVTKPSPTPQRMNGDKDVTAGSTPSVPPATAAKKKDAGGVQAASTDDNNAGDVDTETVSTDDAKDTGSKVKKTSASAYLSKRKKKKDTSLFVPSVGVEEDVPQFRDRFNRKEEVKHIVDQVEGGVLPKALPPPPGLPPGFEDSLHSVTLDNTASYTNNMGDTTSMTNSGNGPVVSPATTMIDSQDRTWSLRGSRC